MFHGLMEKFINIADIKPDKYFCILGISFALKLKNELN